METEKEQAPSEELPKPNPAKARNYVYPIRDWKEYAGESILIIFSVLLALLLSEFLNKQHEKEVTANLIKNIVEELNKDKKSIQEMQAYNLRVLAKIDTILADKNLQEKVVNNDEFNLKVFAPNGVLYRYLDEVAWTIAKNNNIMSRVDKETISVLTQIYDDMGRIGKVEEDAAKIFLDPGSRDPKAAHRTLVLFRDVYHGWAVDRVPGLLYLIDKTIADLEKRHF